MGNDDKRPPARRLRPVRVLTPGLRARIGNIEGDLVNVSATGALIRTDHQFPVGSSGSVVLDLDSRRIGVEGEVVRCQPVHGHLPGGTATPRKTYTLGVRFLDPERTHVVASLCEGRTALEELQYGVSVVGDNTPLTRIIRKTLADAGYDVHVEQDASASGADARIASADLVVINMQQERLLNPWEIVERLTGDPDLGYEILVIIERASLTAERRRYVVERNAHLLVLPFTPEDLLTAVEQALRGTA